MSSGHRGSKEAADATVQEIAKAGGTAAAYQVDVTDPKAAQECAEAVEKLWGPVNILVNNAGVIHDDLFVRLEPENWNKVLATNLGGTYNFCKAVAYGMMKQRKGRIINVSSVAAEHVNMGQTNYAASKGRSTPSREPWRWSWPGRGVTNAVALASSPPT